MNDRRTASRRAIISLLTDFGDRDEYVGVLKGVILGRAPEAVIVDLCHHIVPHDIRQAAAMMAAAYRHFPPGTLHVMVVDPGVGSARDIVWVRTKQAAFLCPDNGLLTPLVTQGELCAGRRVTNQALFADAVSATFHGRDIIAPVAGFLASGGAPEKLGPELTVADLVCFDDVPARLDGRGGLQGTVMAVDRFGNIITNIGRELLTSAWEGDLNQLLSVEVGRVQRMPLVSSYCMAPAGQLLATIGSRNTLEIAVNQGNAAHRLGVAPGALIRIARAENPG